MILDSSKIGLDDQGPILDHFIGFFIHNVLLLSLWPRCSFDLRPSSFFFLSHDVLFPLYYFGAVGILHFTCSHVPRGEAEKGAIQYIRSLSKGAIQYIRGSKGAKFSSKYAFDHFIELYSSFTTFFFFHLGHEVLFFSLEIRPSSSFLLEP